MKLNDANAFDKYVTDVVTVVVSRDTENTTKCGFYVKTAYPNIDMGELTNEQYSVKWFMNNLEGRLSKTDELKLYIKSNYKKLDTYKYKENGFIFLN